MIVVISGSNRPAARTLVVARAVEQLLRDSGAEVELLDLRTLPSGLFEPDAYAERPEAFEAFQQPILAADGLLTVVPEYNGSYPGALKYFIDMLRFPESLYEKPSAFVGLSTSRWGGVRAVEQLEMVFQFRHAHLFGRRVFLPAITSLLDDTGALADTGSLDRLRKLVVDFAAFCRRLS